MRICSFRPFFATAKTAAGNLFSTRRFSPNQILKDRAGAENGFANAENSRLGVEKQACHHDGGFAFSPGSDRFSHSKTTICNDADHVAADPVPPLSLISVGDEFRDLQGPRPFFFLRPK